MLLNVLNTRTLLMMLAAAFSSACPNAVAATTEFPVFLPTTPFICSPYEKIGCSGLLAPRVNGSTSEPNETTLMAILPSGPDSLAARLQTLSSAKRSIRIQALVFTGDESGLAVADILKQKKKEGLDVRVIVDGMSNPELKSQLMYFDLKNAGVEVEGFEPGYMQWVNEVSIERPTQVNKRFHDKMWVVDAEEPAAVSIVGGMNIANEYFKLGLEPEKRWRDQDVIVKGPMIQDIARVFDRNYEYFKDIKARATDLFNTDRYFAVWRKFLHWSGLHKRRLLGLKRNAALSARIAELPKREVRLQYVPVTARFFQNRPRFKESYIHQVYLDMINAAKSEILIANAYFIPPLDIIKAFSNAVKRGVNIKIITNSPETNDLPQMAYASRYLYKDILDANRQSTAAAESALQGAQSAGSPKGTVEIYEWRGNLYDEGTMHAKFAVFDRRALIVGSYNLDARSQTLNSETVMAIESPEMAEQLAQDFIQNDLFESEQINFDLARRFHVPEKMAEKFNLYLWWKLRAVL